MKNGCNRILEYDDVSKCIHHITNVISLYDIAKPLIKPKRKYGFENACEKGDLIFVQRYRKEFLGLSAEGTIKELCRDTYHHLLKHEEDMEQYDKNLKCCLSKGTDCVVDCHHLLSNNQCRDLVTKEFKDVMLNELYIYTEDGVRYCFLLTEIIKGDGTNPISGNPLPIVKEEALDRLIKFYSWMDFDTVKLQKTYLFDKITTQDQIKLRKYLQDPSEEQLDHLLGLTQEIEVDGWKYYLIPVGTLLFRAHRDNPIRFPSNKE